MGINGIENSSGFLGDGDNGYIDFNAAQRDVRDQLTPRRGADIGGEDRTSDDNHAKIVDSFDESGDASGSVDECLHKIGKCIDLLFDFLTSADEDTPTLRLVERF